MKQFSNYDDAKKAAEHSGSAQLPAGAYTCKIMAVRYDKAEDDQSDRIQIQFDIAEGEHKDFFRQQYDSNQNEDRKWKGKTAIYVPTDDGSERDGWTKNAFARWTNAIEKSNSGYSWDWDESKWKGKLIGLVFGPTGTVIQGKEIVYTEVHQPCSVDEVKNGTFWKKALELKKKNGYTGTQQSATANSSEPDSFMKLDDSTEEEIPF